MEKPQPVASGPTRSKTPADRKAQLFRILLHRRCRTGSRRLLDLMELALTEWTLSEVDAMLDCKYGPLDATAEPVKPYKRKQTGYVSHQWDKTLTNYRKRNSKRKKRDKQKRRQGG